MRWANVEVARSRWTGGATALGAAVLAAVLWPRVALPLLVVPLSLAGLLAAATGTSTDGGTTLIWSGVLWGCIAGTLWAELSVTRPSRPTGGARVASQVPREPAAYLGRPLRWGPALAALGLLQYVEALDAPAADGLFGVAAAASLGSALVAWWSRAWWRPVRRPTPSPVDVQA